MRRKNPSKQKKKQDQRLLKYYHPKDLIDIYHEVGKARGDMEHLSYKVNYFFKKDLNKPYFDFRYDKIEVHQQTTKTVKTMLNNRLLKLAQFSEQTIVKIFEAEIASQLVHGLGTAHVLDTAITIHPVYGVPYIPASSLKGIVRHYFIQTFFKGDGAKLAETAERTAKEEKLYKLYADIFGTQEGRGLVNFLDVYFPSGTLEADIMAVQFRSYYNSGGKDAPREVEPPLPVNFYVLKSDEPVEFVYYMMKNRKPNSNFTHEEIAKIVGDWLQGALTHMGLGSKTSRGYGRFTNIKEVDDEKLENLKRRQKQAKQERIRKQLERKKRKEEAKRLASMTEEERLVYTIEQLDPKNVQDLEKSKGALFNEVIETNNIEAARALKEYWIKSNLWVEKKKPKKKQEIKVTQIKKLLNES